MLDVIARLEAAGSGTSFGEDGLIHERGVLGRLADDLIHEGERWRSTAMACLIMTPDGGETEPQHDQPDQDDDGKQDQDDQDSRDA